MRRRKITIAELRAQTATQIPEKWEFIWGLTLRRISPYPAWLFLRLGISANTVTYLSFIMGFTGCGLLAFSHYMGMIIGALFINICFLLDYVDGSVARATDSASEYGRFLDHLNIFSIGSLLFFSLGIGTFRHPDFYPSWLTEWLFAMQLNESIFLILGGWAALFFIFPRFLALHFQDIFSRKFRPLPRVFVSRSTLPTVVRTTVSNLHGSLTPLLLMAAIFSFLSVYLLFYALFFTLLFITRLVETISRAKQIQG